MKGLGKEIQALFSEAEEIDKNYTKEQITGLPEPVQRYFLYALPDEKEHISYCRLKHTGKFKTKPEKNWVDIKGQEYFTIDPKGFIWIGKTPMFIAKDKYFLEKGSLQVKLFTFLEVLDKKGKKLDESELLRWLAEAPWYPTALLPDENLQWEKIDKGSAKVRLKDGENQVEGIFHFNQKGQIIRFQAERYRGEELENWIGYYDQYTEKNKMKIPMFVEVAWDLKEGEYSYARFEIEEIEYNRPERYKK